MKLMENLCGCEMVLGGAVARASFVLKRARNQKKVTQKMSWVAFAY